MQPPFVIRDAVRTHYGGVGQRERAVFACDAAGEAAALEPGALCAAGRGDLERHLTAPRRLGVIRIHPAKDAAIFGSPRRAPCAVTDPHCLAPELLDVANEVEKRDRLHGLTGRFGSGVRAGGDGGAGRGDGERDAGWALECLEHVRGLRARRARSMKTSTILARLGLEVAADC